MAARARTVLLSERRRVMVRLNSSEFGRQRLEQMPALKPDTLKGVDLDSPNALLEINERALRGLIDGVLDVLPELDRRRIESVTVESDTTSASTRSFSDGSHLVMVSDAMMTLVDLLGALLSAWTASKGRLRITSTMRRTWQARRSSEVAATDPLVLGGAASLRYTIVHQRLWAMSAKVLPQYDIRTALTDTERGFGPWALFYILAHELGHIALGHTHPDAPRDARTQSRNELAADDFAYPTCTRLFGGGDAAANITGVVAIVAQSAIALSTDHLFVRSPETHPPVLTRLRRIAAQHPGPVEAATSSYWGLTEMVSRGIDADSPLPEHYWAAMMDRPEFDTRHHSANYFTMIRGMDLIAGYTPERVRTFIDGLTEHSAPQNIRDEIARVDLQAVARALEYFAQGEAPRAVDALGVRHRPAILDVGRSLSFHALVESLLDSAALSDEGSHPELTVRTIAFTLANLAAPLLTRND